MGKLATAAVIALIAVSALAQDPNDLTGRDPSDTYRDLLWRPNGNLGLDVELRRIFSGNGIGSPFYISTEKVRIDGLLNDATGDENALTVNYEVDKATDGVTSGIAIYATQTNVPDTDSFLRAFADDGSGMTEKLRLEVDGITFPGVGTITPNEYPVGAIAGSETVTWFGVPYVRSYGIMGDSQIALALKGGDLSPVSHSLNAGYPVVLSGGEGGRWIDVVNYADPSVDGSTVTFRYYSTLAFPPVWVSTTVTEGVEWQAATSNTATALSLAEALTTAISGYVAFFSWGSSVYYFAFAPIMAGHLSTTALASGLDAKQAAQGDVRIERMLGAATGNETAATIEYEVDKLTSGDDTGLLVRQINSNSPGASLLIDGQVGTSSKFSVSNTGHVTADSLQLDASLRQWADTVTLADDSVTDVLDVAMTDGSMIGGKITYTIAGTDGTDSQSLSGSVTFSAVRKGAAYSVAIAEDVTPVLAESSGSSSLTDVWTMASGTDKVTVRVNADSSLTTTSLSVRYQLQLNGSNVITKK